MKPFSTKKLLETICKTLSKNTPDSAQLWACSLEILEQITGFPSTKLLSQETITFDSEQGREFERIIMLIEQEMPISYILGDIPFLELSLKIIPPILIPRPETEYWVSLLIKKLHKERRSPKKIIDLCTGSGCIALALAQAFRSAAVTAIDIVPQAIDLARKNAVLNKLPLEIYQSDLFSAVPSRGFDLIVANPPYISAEEYRSLPRSVKNYEDPTALTDYQDGISITSKLIEAAPRYASREALFWCEIDRNQTEQVIAMMRKESYSSLEIIRDQYGRDRVVSGVIAA